MALKAEEVYAILKKQIQSGGGQPGTPGRGIEKIELTDTQGLVDTYTITYTDETTTTYTVTNGADGQDGQDGQDGVDGASGIFPQTAHGTADTTFTLPANQYHTWGEVAALTLTLAAETTGVVNEYHFAFDSGDTAMTLSLPEGIQTDIVVESNTHYECSIIDNYMTFRDWPAEVSA